MFRQMLRSKIHRATVTESCLDYEGSLTIDEDLMDAAGNRHYTIRAIPYEDSEMEAARLKVLHEARVMFPWSDQEEGHRTRGESRHR